MYKYVFIILAPFMVCGQQINENHELLWEISGNGLQKKSYVFGSFHSNDKRLFNLSDSTYFALHNSEVISLEADMFSLFDEWDTRVWDVKLKYDNEGKPYVSSAEPSETYYGNEDGMPQFLDAYFQQYCYNAAKEFFPLETVDFQFDLFDDIKMPELTKFRFESLLMTKEEMLNVYLDGDIYSLDEMLRSSLSIYPGGYEKLISGRNFGMAHKLDSLIKMNKSVFCTVGAGHLPGAKGLISLLRSKGYSVRKITSSYSEKNTEFKDKVIASRVYHTSLDSLGIYINFPGKPSVVEDEMEEFICKLVYKEFGQGNGYEVEIYPRFGNIGLEELASTYIASPSESPSYEIQLDNGGLAFEGIAETYADGVYWSRIIMSEDHFVLIKAFGGNKFMNSRRAQRFFDNVWFE